MSTNLVEVGKKTKPFISPFGFLVQFLRNNLKKN